MIFVSGSIGLSGGADNVTDVDAMAAGRRTARSHPVVRAPHEYAAVVSAGCRVDTTASGRVWVALFRPVWERRAIDEKRLVAIGAAWRAGKMLPIAQIDGPFLLIAVDREAKATALATDRFGMCPVYVRVEGETLNFATDIDALAACPGSAPELDPQALYDYLFFHCIQSPRTIYRGIRKLEPAECLSWKARKVETTTYWLPSFAVEGTPLPGESALVDALKDAVESRVIPGTGSFLSGGLDSSSVAGMLSKVAGRADTFTIGFDAKEFDESGFARIVAEHFDTQHREYFVAPADVLDALPRIAAHYGEPFGNSSVVPTYLCARFAQENGIRLLLAGDGGDELFAGNTRYMAQDVFELYGRLPVLVRTFLEGSYKYFPLLERLPVAGKGARYIKQARMGLPDRLQSYNFLHRFDPETVFEPEWLCQCDTEAPWELWRQRYDALADTSTLQRMLYLDWKFTLAGNDLVKVSHMCDLAGVEVAYPMLDSRIVDLSCRLPATTLLQQRQLRGYYKHAFRSFLPEATISKVKHGFGLPFGLWLRTDSGLRALADDALAGMDKRRIFRSEFLASARRLHEESAAGYYGELVWLIMSLELWLQAHGVR